MKLRLTRRAQANLASILEFVGSQNPAGALNVLRAIERAFEVIADFPKNAVTTDDARIRVKLVSGYPYKIFCRLARGGIEVVHIRHAARLPWKHAKGKQAD